MKIPMINSGVIIANAALLNWHLDSRLAAARGERTDLTAKAAQSGVSVEANRGTRSTARPRIDHVADVHQLAREYIRLLQQSPEGESDEETRSRFQDCQERFPDLNANGWEIMIEELLAFQAIDEKRRMNIARYWLRQFLSNKNPCVALDFVKVMKHSKRST